MARKSLFIEGANTPELRQGFHELLGKALGANRPVLNLGGSKTNTIAKYLHNPYQEDSILIVDLDGPEDTREDTLSQYGLKKHHRDVFFMVQEMESWFISQRNIPDKFFGTEGTNKDKVSGKLPKRPAAEIVHAKKHFKDSTVYILKK